jgi:hypothetical protein
MVNSHLGALMNALSSQQSVFDRHITLERSTVAFRENSANSCYVSALHIGEDARYRSSGSLGGAFGVYLGASSHSTSSSVLSSLISGGIFSRNLTFLFENNNISSCFASLNVTGRSEVATASGGALAFHLGFFSFSQVYRSCCITLFYVTNRRRTMCSSPTLSVAVRCLAILAFLEK